MTEEEARAWVEATFGAAATARLDHLAGLVIEENGRQNLIAASTVPMVWNRHIADSAQLIPLAPAVDDWLDVGTGGGFPGLVVAILRSAPITFIEPRRRRVEFLERCVRELRLPNATVIQGKLEKQSILVKVISARAVASIDSLLNAAPACANPTTRWLFPRGQVSEDDLDHLRRRWRGVFHVKQSLTDPSSSIVIADGVSRR